MVPLKRKIALNLECAVMTGVKNNENSWNAGASTALIYGGQTRSDSQVFVSTFYEWIKLWKSGGRKVTDIKFFSKLFLVDNIVSFRVRIYKREKVFKT